jgi:hypothetical protein
MQSSTATDLGEVRSEEGLVAGNLDRVDTDRVFADVKKGKSALPALKRIMDYILLKIAIQINYSSMHPYDLFQRGIRGAHHLLKEEDILEGGCCYPNMDCVGSAYFIRQKIITTLNTYDEEGTFQF